MPISTTPSRSSDDDAADLADMNLVFAERPRRAQEIDLAVALTGRELQIAALVSSGYLNKQIGVVLKISEYTVATHIRRIFSKLNINKRSTLAYMYAMSAKRGDRR